MTETGSWYQGMPSSTGFVIDWFYIANPVWRLPRTAAITLSPFEAGMLLQLLGVCYGPHVWVNSGVPITGDTTPSIWQMFQLVSNIEGMICLATEV